MSGSPYRILVLCTGNSARSQIAEALLEKLGGDRIEAKSAGSSPAARVNPYATEVLREHGIEWDGRVPRSIDDLSGEQFDLVITVCDNARAACPIFPGAGVQVHWGMPDPAEQLEPEKARPAFRETYAALENRIRSLLALPIESLDRSTLRQQVQRIHAAQVS